MKPSVAVTLAAALLATAPAFAAHFQTFRFSLAPGGSKPVSMPETLTPVRASVGVSFSGGGLSIYSNLMTALVEEDPGNHQLTWIGTNADGTTVSSTTFHTSLVAYVNGNATLNASPGSGSKPGTLTVNNTSTQSCSYVLTLVY
jgi:hypothetical protein